VGLEK